DTISICLSKGLGTPLGSVLIGDEAIMNNAMRVRKVLGGGMRQIGFMAAAGLYALEHHIDRLREDHQKAKELGNALNNLHDVSQVEPVETNIIIFYLKTGINEAGFLKKLNDKGIRISA